MTREEAIGKWIYPAIATMWNEDKCREILEALEQPILVAKAKAGDVEELLKIIDKGGAIISSNPITLEPMGCEYWCGYCRRDADDVAEVLDKIRAEIEQLRANLMTSGGVYEHSAYGLDYAMQIIDKYKAEGDKK